MTSHLRFFNGLPSILLVIACLLAGPALAETTHVVPMSLVGKHPRIELSIEGIDRPLSFVVDTAAGASVIDASLAEQLGLIDAQRPTAQVQGAGGTSSGVRITELLSLTASTFSWKAQMLAIDLTHLSEGDAPPIEGIIGNDLMTRFDVRFDLPAAQLTLAPKDSTPQTQCMANALPERTAALQRFAFVPATLSDGDRLVEAVAVVDTGAAQTVLNRAAARALGLSDDDARLRLRDAGTRGLSSQAVDTWLYTLPRLSIDREVLTVGEVRVSSLPVFATLGLEAVPALILGVDALKDRAIDVTAGAHAVCLGTKG